jgi:hypothetical protein
VVLEAEVSKAQIERILQNKSLRLSEVQRRLLSYLVDKSLAGEGDDLKEYTIGIDAFGKPSSYDPRQESVVRMHVGRLRQKLAEYYRTEGIDDPVLVDLPKGGFKVTFEPRSPREAPRDAPTRTGHWREIALGAGFVAMLAAAIYLEARPASTPRITAEAPAVWSSDLQQLWAPILSSTRPLVVCLATPVKTESSVGTASGAFLLGQFLAPLKQHVLLTRGDLLSMPEIMMDNVIFVGPPAGNRQLEAVPGYQPISLEPDGIRNLNPRPGEPAFLPDHPSHNAQEVEETHALISHVPGLYGKGEILYLSGNRISSVMAAVQALTDPSLARTLVEKMKSATGSVPHYYQLVLQVKSMDDMPVAISYVFHREIAPSQPAATVAQR